MATRIAVAAFLLFPCLSFAFDHQAWDALLRKNVVVLEGGKASQVRYAAMAQDRGSRSRSNSSSSSSSRSSFGNSRSSNGSSFGNSGNSAFDE